MKENIKLAKELVKVAKTLVASSTFLYCNNSLFTVVVQSDEAILNGEVDNCTDGLKIMTSNLKNKVKKFIELMKKVGYRNVELYDKPAEIIFKNGNFYIGCAGNLHDSQDNDAIKKCCKEAQLNFVSGNFRI